jgi:hypothetical protein
MKRINVLVTYNYDLEIDENNYIVKEYESTKELIEDLASYRFGTLPVIDNGVVIKNIDVHDIDIHD